MTGSIMSCVLNMVKNAGGLSPDNVARTQHLKRIKMKKENIHCAGL
jgi:hypothetical protein